MSPNALPLMDNQFRKFDLNMVGHWNENFWKKVHTTKWKITFKILLLLFIYYITNVLIFLSQLHGAIHQSGWIINFNISEDHEY